MVFVLAAEGYVMPVKMRLHFFNSAVIANSKLDHWRNWLFVFSSHFFDLILLRY